MSDPRIPPAQPPGGPPPGAVPGGQLYPPTYPSAAPYWTPPPTKRRRSRWLTIGLPVGVLMVLGGCGTVAVLAMNAMTGTLGPAMGAGSAYADALVEGRWDDAHAMLCADSRASVSAEQLAEHYGQLVDYSVQGANVHSSGGEATGEVTVRFTSESGLDELTVVPLVRDDDAWRPCP